MKIPTSRSSRSSVAFALLPLLALSCGALQTAAEAPGRVAHAMTGSNKPAPPSTELLISDLLKYADDISQAISGASRAFASAVDTPAARIQAAIWRQRTNRIAFQTAAGPKPLASLLDLLLLTAGGHWVHEDYWMPDVYGEPDRPMLEAFARLEEDGWLLAEKYLSTEQLDEVRGVLDKWREENPDLGRRSLGEMPGFGALVQEGQAQGAAPVSLLGLIGIDPLSGLEPAAREVEQTRQLGERLLFAFHRMPQLISGEVELRVLQAGQAPQTVQVLDDAERVTKSFESFAATAATLPADLRAEGETLVRTISQELSAQREGVVHDLTQAQAPVSTLLEDAQGTLAAGERTSTQLTETIRALDAFVGRFDEPEPQEPKEGSKPFDVVEYGVAAERIGVAARDLSALLSELGQRLPEVERTFDAAAARGERTLDHASVRALAVGLALIAAAAVAALLVRRAGRAPRSAI